MAVRKNLYAPPEFACVDEAVTGRKSRRAGLDRAKFLIQSGRAKVLVVFKLSRLLRSCYKSVAFIQEEIVEHGGRALYRSARSKGLPIIEEGKRRYIDGSDAIRYLRRGRD